MDHVYTITVRGFHCDLYGHVNNARYLEFLEEARWDYVAQDQSLARMGQVGLGFVVAAITIEYKRPVGLGEVVAVHSNMESVQSKRAIMHQEVLNQASGKTVAEAWVTFAVINLETGRAVPMSGEVRSWFEPSSASDTNEKPDAQGGPP